MSDPKSFDPAAVQQALDENRIILIDVREPKEAAAERIPGAILMPLSTFDPQRLPKGDDREIVLHCKSGMRSGRAFELAAKAGIAVAGHMGGGIEAWKAAGLPVERAEDATGMTVPQAVMAMAGSIVLISIAVSLWFGPLWLALGAAASFMLVQASFTGFCPAGRVFTALGFRPG